MEADLGKFAVAVWSLLKNGKPHKLGKHFFLNGKGELVKEPSTVYSNNVLIETFDDLEELVEIIEHELYQDFFIGYGLPNSWKEVAESKDRYLVTLKKSPECVKNRTIQRTKECLSGHTKIGGYLVVDFDPDGFPRENLPDTEDLHRRVIAAAKLGGLDLENCQVLTYKSSSSSLVRESDDHCFDKGGRHLIYLIDDASDIDRFAKDLSIYLALTGSCYGAVSKSGSFLKRGILDTAAVKPHQPTFMAPANFGKGLRVERDIKILGGNQKSIDTKKLSRPSDEQMNSANAFWCKEYARLKPDCEKVKKRFVEQRASGLAAQLAPNTPADVIKGLIKRRLEGRLLGSDVILFDNGSQIRVADILANPSQYDGLNCADPVEPDYGGGKNIAIVYANLESRQPTLFSQAHGGINYQLLFDRETALAYIEQLSPNDRIRQISRVMHLLYTEDDVEAEFSLKKLGKLLGTTKEALSTNYSRLLKLIRESRNPVDSDEQDFDDFANIDSIEYQTARELLKEQNIISTSGSGGYELRIYTGKCWRFFEDAEAQQALTKILSKDGWSKGSGKITRAAQEALQSLKIQSFQLNPPFRSEVQHIINCANGEVWILPDAKVELRSHSPESGLTHVLDVDYDPDSSSQLFYESIVQMFLPPAHQFKKASADEQKQVRGEAERMARYITEILAYFLVPRRWLTNWFLFIGNGSNGKTLLLKIIQLLIPEDAVVNERLQSIADTDFGMARLRDKILLIDDDLATGITLPDGFLKKVSEPKRLSANVKNYPRDVSFNNRCALVLLTNNYPRLKDISHGTTRRVRAIEFPRRFYSVGELSQLPVNQKKKNSGDAADPELLEKLKLELPGILNTLVKAYRDLCRRKDFDIPSSAKQTTKKVLIMAHPLEQFIEEHCTEGEDRYVLRTQFHTKLLQFNIEQENKWRPTIPQIRTEMEQLGYPVKKKRMEDGSVPEVYNGLGLKDSPPISLVPEKPLKKKVK